jgi:argininosuccinate lyase
LKKWLNAFERNEELPKTKLDFFMELFDKAFSPEHGINRGNIEWLNDTRNDLIHFNNDSLSIHKESAVRCCKEALAAIKLTPSIANGIFFYEEQQKKAFENSCRVATELLDLAARET